MRNLYSKRYQWIGLLLVALGVMVLAPIVLRKPPEYTNFFNRMSLDPSTLPDLSQTRLLEAETISNLKKLTRWNTGLIANYVFTLNFSPDNSILGVFGIGYPREYSEVLLWKLKHSQLCVLQVGNPSFGDGTKTLKAFSTDSQFVWLKSGKCLLGNDCTEVRDAKYNYLVNSFYYAQFVNQGGKTRLEYREQADSPTRTSEQTWQIINPQPLPIETIISEMKIQLIDHSSGEVLRSISVEGNINDAKISPDGKLLALAITQPNKFTPYFWDAYVELWGVTDASPPPAP